MEAPTTATPNTAATPREANRGRLGILVKVIVPIVAVAAALYWLYFKPVPVISHTVTPGLVVAEVMGTGTLEARVSTTLSPKISGRIVELLVDQGDAVAAGQILFRLDDADFKQQVELAQSTLAAARNAVERQTAEIQRARAVLELAHIEQRRVEELMATATAAAIELDRTVQALRIAEAESQRADAALLEARTQVIVAEKTLAFQQARLADTVVVAPFAGLIARRDRDAGDIVLPGSSVLLLVATDVMWISAWVDETEMAQLTPDQPARIVFRAEPARAYAGQVTRLSREVDRETREFLVDVRIHELPATWAVGQRAEVYIETGRHNAALGLPTRWIVWRDGRPGAFIAESGRVAWRPLEIGLHSREMVEVTSGLMAGDQVVATLNPQAGALKPGQRVVITETPTPSASAVARP